MFRAVGSKVSFSELELGVLRFWKDRQVFEQSLELRRNAPRFVFYEGPPTANGTPGVHHVLARVFKDVIPRFRTMQGHFVLRKGGWDTHGLPVELEVEKELGITSKQQIEEYGVERFNQKCRESVFRYVKQWEDLTDRIGFWLDVENAYVTYHNSYIESCWWIMRRLWDRELLFQDYKVTMHCPRCNTSLADHEVALGFRDEVDDPSVWVKLPLADQAHGPFASLDVPISFLIWTTTPWTLPANAAVAVSPVADYVVARVGDEAFVVAADLAEQALGTADYEVLARVRGRELEGLRYRPLYEGVGPGGKPVDLTTAYRVVADEIVSLGEGSGLVHIAPAYGDLEVGRRHNLPTLFSVDLTGKVLDAFPPFARRFFKEADPLITRDLIERGLMLRHGRVLHAYPFCWRCDTPLLYYAKTSWYIRTTAVKEQLLAANDEINWYPEHIKWGRFGDWLRNNVDWAVSRERFWGTPLPIWRCQSCGHYHCIGSVAELRSQATTPVPADLDLHRPYIDEVAVRCPSCAGTARRVPEVLDCWYDSGAMPVAQWHYPFENEALFVEQFPADFICEAVDQTRGWFYSLHALSVLLFDRPCYRNVICLGLVLDGKGEKMSKSRGNVVDPWSVINRHGADAVRWYLLTATAPGNPRRFSADLVGEVVRKFLLTLWNTYSFFTTYAALDGWQPDPNQRVEHSLLDRWVRSELHQLVANVTTMLEHYEPTGAGRAIEEFVDVLSNWYVRRSRRRFWKTRSDADKVAAYATLYECLVTAGKLLAPFTPFVAEELYQNLVRAVQSGAPESVHLADFPVADAALIDRQLMDDMRLIMRLVSLGRAARSKANAKVRQPLAEVLVRVRSAAEREAVERLTPLLLDELNVKRLRFVEEEGEIVEYGVKPNLALLGPKYGRELGRLQAALRAADPRTVAAAVRAGAPVPVDGFELAPAEVLVETKDRPGLAAAEEAGYAVAVSTAVSEDLKQEGLARELVHRLQTMRKAADLNLADRIVVSFQGSPKVAEVFRRFAEYVQAETLAVSLVEGPPPAGAYVETQSVDGHQVELGITRA
ncbi:MAG: isoleucine--tRNA ligase [Chloroflexi bacterium]|nr:isoleucine--tRNA ligase [Chloroflexota bacterium]